MDDGDHVILIVHVENILILWYKRRILYKRMDDGDHIILIVHVETILILCRCHAHRYWVREVLMQEYDKVTRDEGSKLSYLGMVVLKTEKGFEILIYAYIEDTFECMGRGLRVVLHL